MPPRAARPSARDGELNAEAPQGLGGWDAIAVPAPEAVILGKERVQLLGRAVHALRGPLGNRDVQDPVREGIVLPAHPLPAVVGPLEGVDPLPHRLDLLEGAVPPRDGRRYPPPILVSPQPP